MAPLSGVEVLFGAAGLIAFGGFGYGLTGLVLRLPLPWVFWPIAVGAVEFAFASVGYAGYNRLLKRPAQDVKLALANGLEPVAPSFARCWAHARRKLHDVAQFCTAPIAQEGLAQIEALYRIEKDLRGLSAEQRRAARQERSKPVIYAFEIWLVQNRARVSAKSPTGEALKHIAKYWDGLCRFLSDGRVERDNNPVERTIRPIALTRKNALFAGHDAGAQNWASSHR